MLSKDVYVQAHKEFPFAEKYLNQPSQCAHNFVFVVYCNGVTDIVRCPKCGLEKEVPCHFDDEYN